MVVCPNFEVLDSLSGFYYVLSVYYWYILQVLYRHGTSSIIQSKSEEDRYVKLMNE